jgi:pimeloyl-ACP methyl ester carboxylesterase
MAKALSEHIFSEPKRFTVFGSSVAYWDIRPDKPRTIVMIHGFRGNHLGLRRLIAELPDYRVVIADLPGFGLSSPMIGQKHDIESYAAVFKALINNLSLQNPHILGHSYGTLVAARLIVDNPDVFDKIVLINTIAVNPHHIGNPAANKLVDFYYWLACALPWTIGEPLLRNRIYAYGSARVLAKSHNRQVHKYITKHACDDMAYPLNRKVIKESYASSVEEGVIDIVEGKRLKALIIGGEFDAIAPIGTQKLLAAAMPGSRLEIITDVGHLIPFEDPEEAAGFICEYLSA